MKDFKNEWDKFPKANRGEFDSFNNNYNDYFNFNWGSYTIIY